ncbi:MAG: enoyl-CoA hydratase/isomerase family protein [Acidobacteriota bacterium]
MIGRRNVLVEISERIAIIRLNRPQFLNALHREALDELRRVMYHLKGDDRVKGAVVTGCGQFFASGADIRELSELDQLRGREYLLSIQRTWLSIVELGKPVVAAVNGLAIGGGLELTLVCSLRLASDKATFAIPGLNLGLIPSFIGVQRLCQLVGRTRGVELILTGKTIDAREALRIGLVSRVLPQAELLGSAIALCKRITAQNGELVRHFLETCRGNHETPTEADSRLVAAREGLLSSGEKKY